MRLDDLISAKRRVVWEPGLITMQRRSAYPAVDSPAIRICHVLGSARWRPRRCRSLRISASPSLAEVSWPGCGSCPGREGSSSEPVDVIVAESAVPLPACLLLRGRHPAVNGSQGQCQAQPCTPCPISHVLGRHHSEATRHLLRTSPCHLLITPLILGTALYPKQPSQLTAIYPDGAPIRPQRRTPVHPGPPAGNPCAPPDRGGPSRRNSNPPHSVPFGKPRPCTPFTPDRRTNAFLFCNRPLSNFWAPGPCLCALITRGNL